MSRKFPLCQEARAPRGSKADRPSEQQASGLRVGSVFITALIVSLAGSQVSCDLPILPWRVSSCGPSPMGMGRAEANGEPGHGGFLAFTAVDMRLVTAK